jgi:DNA-binding HxlR family transcriptional regulator
VAKQYHCAVELTLDIVGGKWRTVILAHLKEGVHRYGELRRRMPDVSEKMLAQRLRELEADGLVVRKDFGTVPPHVEYQLTEEGRSLAPVLQALYDWGTARAARTGTPIVEPGTRADLREV